MEDEVAALFGADITLSDPENQFLRKEEFFLDHVAGRQVLADMEVAGEIQGKSYLAVSVKDAIHLGGILIMLPPAELENVVREEDFSEDARDAYGEIANIISGVYTAVFEEQYNQKLRFIRKELRDVVPAKVDTAIRRTISRHKHIIPAACPWLLMGNLLARCICFFRQNCCVLTLQMSRQDTNRRESRMQARLR